jgi:hypothetical protein
MQSGSCPEVKEAHRAYRRRDKVKERKGEKLFQGIVFHGRNNAIKLLNAC